MSKYLRDNKNFDKLDSESKSLICMAVNRLGDTGIYIEPDNFGFVSEDHVVDCMKESYSHLSGEGRKVCTETLDILGVC